MIHTTYPQKIISGGQTGVDRAALDVAIKLGIEHGGYCPKGRLAEDGIISKTYKLQETASQDCAERTIMNIECSHGTLIFIPKFPVSVTDGTLLTIAHVKKKSKPNLIISLIEEIDVQKISQWINTNTIEILNVAGPRESQSKGIYKSSMEAMATIFQYTMHQKLYL